MNDEIRLIALHGIGEITPGENLAEHIAAATQGGSVALEHGDVVVVTQKVVSKAEGRLVAIDIDDPAAKINLVEGEAVRVLRRRGELRITETTHGFICANSGVDLSNVDAGTAALLPVDPDRSARRIRADLKRILGVGVAVLISDTFGRPWRRGVTDIALGCAGIAAVIDLRGTPDATGRILAATEVCIADELCAAAELVMGKDRGIPVAIVRGAPSSWLRDGSVADEIIRPASEDLFR